MHLGAGVGRGLVPRHFFDLHTANPAVAHKEAARRQSPTALAALFVAARGFEHGGPHGPWCLWIIAHGRLGHDFDLRHAQGALPYACPDTVGSRVATADHQHAASLGADGGFGGGGLAVEQAVLGAQLFERKVDACGLATGQGQVARGGCAGAEDVGVELFGQAFQNHLAARPERDAGGLHQADATVDDVLVELEVRDAVAEQAAGACLALEDGDVVAGGVEPRGSRQPRRPRPDDGHATPRARRVDGGDVALAKGRLGQSQFILADGHGRIKRQAQHACLFAERRADAAGELRKVIRLGEERIGLAPLPAEQGVLKLGRLVTQRAGPVAERHAAVHAARRLLTPVVAAESLLDLTVIFDPLVDGAVARLLARHGEKSFWISHILFLFCALVYAFSRAASAMRRSRRCICLSCITFMYSTGVTWMNSPTCCSQSSSRWPARGEPVRK